MSSYSRERQSRMLVACLLLSAAGCSRKPPVQDSRPAAVTRPSGSAQPLLDEPPRAVPSSSTDPPGGTSPAEVASASNPCLRDLTAHALEQVRLLPENAGANSKASNFSRASLADVDGDGQSESLLVEEYLGTANNPHFLYLSNHGCQRYAGMLWAHAESIKVLPEKRDGMHLLQLFGSNGCAGRAGQVELWSWAQEHFALVRKVECACPDEAPKAKRDPICP